ncbi:1-deoxy-D-xylulose-5-phosphate reductoisomerase [Schlesneria paludicola]|uniref:1-deoxy-D-xylulose-5-phosphate reductoisomerase n=1 Tax=Schlesneria paludicola TaxID=360056 RepID=UPI00029AB3E7|nr:1-deoxy-D-xylulose-5-phosphate reductoisomerase [Schlesneria paludicola]
MPSDPPALNRISVLGSTGSIGTSCLDVIEAHGSRLQATALTAHRSWEPLARQCQRTKPRFAVLADPATQKLIGGNAFPRETEVWFGPEGVERISSHPDVDTVVCGIVGAAGLRGAWAAIESGKRVAIANKETLVVAGPLVMNLAAKTGAPLIPVDSEHSAVFQAMLSGRRRDLKRIVLTASGGPFRGWSRDRLEQEATIARALAHPTWQMGPKITIDSATMMNKALEIIEARWLFDLDADQIAAVIHPQSIVHSFVEFLDGSVLAQLSPPDMKLPIQYALTYPERWAGTSPTMDWTRAHQLDFLPPDLDAFPALALGFEVAKRGGTCGAVLNAANEVAVQRFLDGSLKFTEIPQACGDILKGHNFDAQPSLAELLRLDDWARKEMQRWKSSLSN